ncbi:MAG: hypothetical protein AAF531_26770 [Actinomycetota bacterium]
MSRRRTEEMDQGIASNILTARSAHLQDHGIIARRANAEAQVSHVSKSTDQS